MAVVREACGDCGGVLSPGDAYCPHCGARIERGSEPTGMVERVCDACGFHNSGSGAFCESCGARLSAPPAVQGKREERKEKKRAPFRDERRTKGRKRFEPWQAVSYVAIAVLLGVLIYVEAANDRPQVSKAAPSTASQGTTPSPPPDLGPLEQEAKAHPRDPAALIRLANGLHDNAQYGRAVEAYKRYLELRPDDPDARVDMGICYYQLAMADSVHAVANFDLALQAMETAFKNHPTHQAAAYNMGIVYLHMGNLDESNRWFQRAYELNKDSDLGARAHKILQEHTFTQ